MIHEYRRPSVHKVRWLSASNAGIGEDYWSKTKKGIKVESEDLMKNHWNYSCFKAETEDKFHLLTAIFISRQPQYASLLMRTNLP